MDHFHLTLAEIGNLTDRQIHELYFHKRDEYGSLVAPQPEGISAPKPEEPDSLEKRLRSFDMLASKIGMKPAKRDAARQKVIDSWQRTHSTSATNSPQ